MRFIIGLTAVLALASGLVGAFAFKHLSGQAEAALGTPVTGESHLGQSPLDHVMLEEGGGVPGGCDFMGAPNENIEFFRVFPDGSRDTNPFRVPAGQVFVVTDLDWAVTSGNPGDVLSLILRIDPPADPSTLDAEHEVFFSTITLGRDGDGGTSEAMTTGLVLSAGARICPDLFLHEGASLQLVLIRGYLMMAPQPRGPAR